jgi:hypothetical protein
MPDMKEDNRLRVCSELRVILHNLRWINQDPMDKFVGKLVGILALLITKYY